MDAALPLAPRAAEPLVDLLLRDPERLDAHFADPGSAAVVLPRLFSVSLLATGGHALVMGLVGAQLGLDPLVKIAQDVGIAYAGGFFGAQVAGLPSAWFYALLAGVRQPAWRVAAEAMRAHATTSIVLFGLLPLYLAVALGVAVVSPPNAGPGLLAFYLGFVFPFVAGLAGTRAMYAAFRRQVDRARLDPDAPRSPAPILLVLAWSVLFTAMAPVGVAAILHAR